MTQLKYWIATMLLVSTTVTSNTFAIEDWKLNRLLSPTFSELQDEAVYSHITCYGNVDEVIANIAMDRQFERIQYMYFGSCEAQLEEGE